MDAKIFKAYDIRGRVPDQWTSEDARLIGRAYADVVKPKTVVVGQDMRVSSPEIFQALTDGLRQQGVNVIDIGLSPTPVMYFAVQHLHADGGLNVTASHNPKDDNGLKLVRADAVPIAGETGIYEIRDRIFNQTFEPAAAMAGTLTKTEGIMDAYIQKHLNAIGALGDKPLTVVCDTGNGMGGLMVEALFSRFPAIRLHHLYPELDGSFPNHVADPLKPENLVDAQKKVLETHADLGVVFDGDGDRMVMIDEKGESVSADFLTALIGEELLRSHPGATMMFDLRSSLIVKETIEAAGGKTLMCRVGHSYIKQQMRENGALFAGELSGHLYFREMGIFEAPLMALLLILQKLQNDGKTFSELVAPLRKYAQSGEINSEVEDKDGKMKELEHRFQAEATEISWLDGIRIQFDDWWFNVRASNTEPLLRLNLEAPTKEKMEEKRDLVLSLIRNKD